MVFWSATRITFLYRAVFRASAAIWFEVYVEFRTWDGDYLCVIIYACPVLNMRLGCP
jgi:hypothetical protein